MSDKQSGMIRSLILSLLLLIGGNLWAQEPQTRTWLWQISGGELQGKSFLFGTMPLQDSTYFQFDPKLWKNIAKTDVYLSFDEESNSEQKSIYEYAAKEYGVTPKDYLKRQVEIEFKPTVSLKDENSLATLILGNSTKKATRNQIKELEEAYISGDIEKFVSLRTSLDVPKSVYESLGKKHNYILINELIDQMKLQPVFVAIDPLYLTSSEGLVSLFKARGYLVKPVSEKFYTNNAKQLELVRQQRLLIAQQKQVSPLPSNKPTQPPTQTISAPTTPTNTIKLDLPIGILNLNQWSDYSIKSWKIDYQSPLRLKNTDNNRPNHFEAKYGDLVYEIDVVDKWANTKIQIDKIIIQNGGQIVNSRKFITPSIRGEEIELMYTDNQISRHLLVSGLEKNLIVSVKGKTPTIHTVLADQFLNGIVIDQLPTKNTDIQSIGLGEPVVTAPAVQWTYQSLDGVQFSFPTEFTEEESTLKNGGTIKALISSRTVDNNTYVLVANQKESFDNFQLFNTSINYASSQVRGVIVDRNVMPDGQPDFAEYIIKDAVDRYYRIQYRYVNGTFYQAIVKGDKKSIGSINANQFLGSMLFF